MAQSLPSAAMDYVVVGAGAIGGTIGARLAAAGRDVLLCDADPDHVAAINARGLAIEGPVEELTARAPAVTPEGLPERLGTVLLAVKAHHTQRALDAIVPRLRPDGVVVSLQNGINEPAIARRVGEERTLGAFVNFGADYLAPGRIFLAGRGAVYLGELDGSSSERLARLVADLPDARATDNIMGFLWGKEASGARLSAPAVSALSIADALAEPRYAALFVRLAREVLACAPARPEAFDGFEPDDLEGSLPRLMAFNRRSAKTHSGIYRDLVVRRRKTEVDALLEAIDGPLVRRTAALIHAIEDGRRRCEVANLELLAAYARLEEDGPRLNAVIATLDPAQQPQDGPLRGVPVAI